MYDSNSQDQFPESEQQASRSENKQVSRQGGNRKIQMHHPDLILYAAIPEACKKQGLTTLLSGNRKLLHWVDISYINIYTYIHTYGMYTYRFAFGMLVYIILCKDNGNNM